MASLPIQALPKAPDQANVEAEAALIGALLMENDLIAPIAEVVSEGDFYEPAHQRIFAAAVQAVAQGKSAAPLLLKPQLEHDETLKALGGFGYIAGLTGNGAGLLIPFELAEQVRDLAFRRRARGALSDLIAAVGDLSLPAAEIAGRLRQVPAIGDDCSRRAGITASPYVWRDPSTLPRRPWLFGRWLLRGSVYVVIAPGAVGKSTLLAGIALSLCTERPLLGQEVWGGPKRVWIWNLEDSRDDLSFSIQAAALHWGISEADVGGRLFVDSGLDGATLKLARMTREGPQINQEVSAQIVEELLRRQIDALIIDPFISSHGLTDENDNAAIDMVTKEWARIATATKCAIVLAHHAKKLNGGEVTAESSRGASSLVDGGRGGRALNTMTKAEAERFGIPLDQRRRFFRAEDAKPNRAPAGAGQWFEIVSVHLGNADDGGDSVGVATPWKAPDPFDDVSTHHLKAVQAKIADGDWRKDVQAKDWAGHVVADVLELDLDDPADKAKAKSILATWITNGALRVESRKDKKGDERPFIAVGSVA